MSTDIQMAPVSGEVTNLAKPVHIQNLEKALHLEPLLNYVEAFTKSHPYGDTDTETSTDADTDYDIEKGSDGEGNKIYNGVVISKAERKADKARLYNFTKVKKGRKWLKNVLLSDTSSDEELDDEKPMTKDYLHSILKQHKYLKKCSERFHSEHDVRIHSYDLHQYQYYSVGLLSHHDKYLEHQKLVLGPRRKALKEQKKLEKKLKKVKLKKMREMERANGEAYSELGRLSKEGRGVVGLGRGSGSGTRTPKAKKITPEQMLAKRRKLWISLSKKEIPKVAKECQKECRRAALHSQKIMKEAAIRARRLSKEMMVYWKRFEKVEKEHRKRAEKEAQEQRKMDLELLEMKRQQRKLNFLITQTELYAHFMARKMTGETEKDKERILGRLDEKPSVAQKSIDGTTVTDVIRDQYDSEEMKAVALRNAEDALQAHQMRGMNWLANLYDQGINGILADEMGLGKTVQSIALLAYMAEVQNIWGPFLVVAPASTLHNWQQEVSKFLPAFKVVPYWGNTQDRKILRKFWNQDNFQTEDASFHMVVTSYQLVIQDVRYFQKIRWHYMILDEAQAIKSTASARWKVLLGFNCRNRLLLTGTPIQNSMGELWALLHFIMPTLFDSHDEFNEWFSKDIESHAEKQSGIDENQLSRLHMILKPFMLRRIKKDVENELSDKIEILVYCPFTLRQKLLYQGIKNKISIDDLLQSSNASSTQAQNTTSSLMNLVMQFRKVCNHPELFERRDIRSPLFFRLDPYLLPKLIFREGNRFIDLSPAELYGIMLKGLLYRWLMIVQDLKNACHIKYRMDWDEKELQEVHTRYLDNKSLLLAPDFSVSAPAISQSTHLKEIVFVSPLKPTYAFLTHTIHYIPETQAHRNIRLRRHSARSDGMKSPVSAKRLALSKTPLSPTKKLFSDQDDEHVHPHCERPSVEITSQQTEIPSFLSKVFPRVHAASLDYYCCDQSASWQHKQEKLCGTLEAANSLLYGTSEIAEQVRWSRYYFSPTQPGGLMAIRPEHGFSGVLLPDKEMLVTDAGKLFVLDSLLHRLKVDGHRVLIYSQMTRMIDILEDSTGHAANWCRVIHMTMDKADLILLQTRLMLNTGLTAAAAAIKVTITTRLGDVQGITRSTRGSAMGIETP
ncbi:hypothetical protein LSH36_89g05001 [Paralvinella palmiformis]|uniref:Chromatin-remodeling ATPase INO80 n=1 Tax=Paralvinella palmiformis TaxID=53620 RepID=A0AAD9K146_9ANNE|nr:hypothetical protein LSH36_89g05001 [Paralvinella palmiformis]